MLPDAHEVAINSEGAIGGVSWLELYLYYTMHGGAKEGQQGRLLAKSQTLQSSMKEFKKRVRQISKHCVKVEDEWRFHTCQGRTNRMNELAICNRHAAIRGMPATEEEEEAQMITKAVLAMRGVDQKKQ